MNMPTRRSHRTLLMVPALLCAVAASANARGIATSRKLTVAEQAFEARADRSDALFKAMNIARLKALLQP